jgi:hypothetical protein
MISRVYDALARVAAAVAVVSDFDWGWWASRRRSEQERRLDKAQALILGAELRAERAESTIRNVRYCVEEAAKDLEAGATASAKSWLWVALLALGAAPALPIPFALGRSGLPQGEEAGPVERALVSGEGGL